MEFRSTAPLHDIPDHLTIPQFMFEYEHPNRPTRDSSVAWMIENDTGRRLFGEDIRRRTFALANSLKIKYNFGEDDVALIYSRNHIDYPIMMWAVHTLGGIISGANPDFSVGELSYQVEKTKPTLLVTLPECAETAAKAAQSAGIPLDQIVLFNVPPSATNLGAHTTARSHVSVDELVKLGSESEQVFEERKLQPGEAKTKLAFLSFSSGTTGKPKAVAIPHYSIIANVIQMAVHNKVNEDYCPWEDRRFRPGDVVNGVLPLFHAYGMHINLHFCLFNAMTYVLFNKFNHVQMLEGIIRYRITHLMLVPPQIILLCKHPATERYDLSRVRCIMSGAAPLATEVNERLYQMFPEAHIGQTYGMTETCTISVMLGIEKKRGTPQAAGVIMPGVTIHVMKGDGTLAGYDEEGELVVKSPSVANGYFNNKQATDETFVDGWVKTGDVAKISRTGEVLVVDRLKEIMKVKGFQVAPAELEGCLLDHPDVASACVVGIPDDFCGEVPLAFIVLRTPAAERVACDRNAAQEVKASIMKHVADQKVGYKRLVGGIEFLDAIPTSPSGKLLRRILREKARELRVPREGDKGRFSLGKTFSFSLLWMLWTILYRSIKRYS
jgi:acyl-CoA synthetase (AMP-forming)/AMP-acid ligase II